MSNPATLRGIVLGTVKYNGWDFPGPCSVGMRCTPVRDTANRSTKYFHYSVTVTTTIVPSDAPTSSGAQTTNDPWLGTLRGTLMQPGQSLQITGHGHGNDLTNLSRDTCLNFGPIPMSYDFAIIGANLAGKLTWTVEFDVPHCTVSGVPPKGIEARGSLSLMGESNFGVTYAHDESGLTTRIISGTVESLVHLSGSGIDRTADALIDGITPYLPEGFKRSKVYDVSPDKRMLTYTVTDREIGTQAVYPDRIIKADVDFTVDSAGSTKFPLLANFQWACSIDGSVEVAQGISKGFGLQAILGLVQQRIYALTIAQQADVQMTSGQSQTQPPPPSNIILVAFHMRDSLYSQRLDVSLSFMVMGMRLQDILATSEIWRPAGTTVPNPNIWQKLGVMSNKRTWSDWQKSDGIATSIMRPRGYANLSSPAGMDVVVSFCQDVKSPSNPAYQSDIAPVPTRVFPSTTYDANASWLLYDIHIEHYKESATMVHQPTYPSSDSQEPLAPTMNGMGSTATGVSSGKTIDAANPPAIIQERGGARVHIELWGHCKRVGVVISGSDLAYIATIGGQPASEEYAYTDGPKRVGFTADRIPIYECNWMRQYSILGDQATTVVAPSSVPDSLKKWVEYPNADNGTLKK